MYKKTLLSLAVASTLTLTGCLDSGDKSKNASPDYKIVDTTFDTSKTRPIFQPNPISPSVAVPSNYDLLMLLGATKKNYDFTGISSGTSPASNAINDFDGFSTTGQFDIRFNNSLNPATVLKGQSVFVVPLNTLPVSALAPLAVPKAIDPSNIDQSAPFDLATYADPSKLNYRVEVASVDSGTNNAIRITPLLPLPSQTKFLVFMTDAILDTDGVAIEPSKDYSYYSTAEDKELGSASLQAVRDLVKGHDTLARAFVKAGNIPNNVVMSHTFTTTDPDTVMHAMASPGTAMTQIGQQVVLLSALQVVKDEKPLLKSAKDQFAALKEALAIIADPSDSTTDEIAFAQKVGAALAPYQADATLAPTLIGEAFAQGGFPFPKPRDSHIYSDVNASTLTTFAALPDGHSLKTASMAVNVSQGAIELPYYSPLPAGSDGTSLVTGLWRGSETLETLLNTSITSRQGSIPTLSNFSFLRDEDGTFNVTYWSPIPEEQATVAVPITIIKPNNNAPACGGTGRIDQVAIFQHGITADRSVSLIPAVNMAATACIATVAIDQPLHGLGGANLGSVPGLDVLTADDVAGSPVSDADYIGERHFMFTDTSGTLTPELQTDITNVESGSLAINIKSLQTTRDSLRQAANDLLNVNASLKTLGLSGVLGSNILAGKPVHFIGHSLGGIAGTPYAAINNNQAARLTYAAPALAPLFGGTTPFNSQPFFSELESVSLMNTGGQLTKLAENSSVFSGAIVNGLGSFGVTQGSSDFESFLYTWQGTVDAIDPLNYAIDLGSTTTKILISEVLNDLRVPNEANVNPLSPATSAPLAGTEPLMALLDIGLGGSDLSDGSEGLGIIDASSTASAGLTPPQASFFANSNPCADASHVTFIAPATPENPNDAICPGGSDTSAAFKEMITEVTTLIAAGVIPVANPTVLGTSTTIGKALDQN
ncbi:hypothetical protein [Alkalimarinus alittae]|uniref:Uncharacterized protein n=1 Tax=Alkalimarinus alittae TaxID=2961619 RepID=A0ABY6MYG6_9ALTE|nr:hypothetical protein [Alkalimarinus alittae]UZE94886.1 hypothetical protein NKI27_12455 [Alkalimarinus alittae]